MRVPESTVRNVIDRDPELRSVYGTTGKMMQARMPSAPAPDEVMERDPDDIPPLVGSDKKATVEIVQMVNEAERELHFKALKALEVNDQTVKKLRDLQGLASSTGAFIAIGLETTHRLYYLSLIELKTVADQIKERYLDPGADGKPQVSAEFMPYYYRNYVDCVKEFGRGYDLFIQGASVILKMAMGEGGGEEKKKLKARLGFTGRSVRNVTAPTVPPNG